jgi:GNAT superfamily N-acetyltransferase
MSQAPLRVAVTVRPARRDELAEVVQVLGAAYETFRGCFPPAIFETYLQDVRNVEARLVHGEMVVAEQGLQIVGAVTFYPDASCDHGSFPAAWAGFRALGVHPAARGLGLGRRLSTWCIDAARRNGAPTVAIHTHPNLVAASRIYRELGFRRCPEFDFSAAESLRLDPARGDMQILAYRLDLKTSNAAREG